MIENQQESFFRQEAIEHQAEQWIGEVALFHPSSYSFLTISIIVITAACVLFLAYGKYDRKEVVTGYVEPLEGVVKIYPKSPGNIVETHVSDGDLVAKGEELITVLTARMSQGGSDVESQIIKSLKQTEAHLLDKISHEQQLRDIKKNKLSTNIAGLEEEIALLSNRLQTARQKYRLSQERIDNYKTVLENGLMSQSDFQDHRSAHLDNLLEKQGLESDLLTLKSKYSGLIYELEELPVTSDVRLSDLNQAISELRQQLIDMESKRFYTLVAPRAGRVTAFKQAIGSEVDANTLVLAILPEHAEFEARLFLPTRSIGFIEPNQTVNIRYDAFPYQRFGVYGGSVSSIANVVATKEELPSALPLDEPVYQVTVTLHEQSVRAYGKSMSLQPGMTLEADIILDNMTFVDWLFDPLYRVTGKSQ